LYGITLYIKQEIKGFPSNTPIMAYVRNLGAFKPCGFDPRNLNNNDSKQLNHCNRKPLNLSNGTSGNLTLSGLTTQGKGGQYA